MVLPEPVGPTTPSTLPAGTETVTPASAGARGALVA